MIQLTSGVRISGLKPEALLGLLICERVFSKLYSQDLKVVSVVDGDHDGGEFSTSSHYAGMAFDIEKPAPPTAWLSPDTWTDAVAADLVMVLGDEFHVLAHKTKEHIHIAYMPKRK